MCFTNNIFKVFFSSHLTRVWCKFNDNTFYKIEGIDDPIWLKTFFPQVEEVLK